MTVFLEMTLPHLAKPSLSLSQTVYKQVSKFKYTYSAGDTFLKVFGHLILSFMCSSTFPNQVTFIHKALATQDRNLLCKYYLLNSQGSMS